MTFEETIPRDDENRCPACASWNPCVCDKREVTVVGKYCYVQHTCNQEPGIGRYFVVCLATRGTNSIPTETLADVAF